MCGLYFRSTYDSESGRFAKLLLRLPGKSFKFDSVWCIRNIFSRIRIPLLFGSGSHFYSDPDPIFIRSRIPLLFGSESHFYSEPDHTFIRIRISLYFGAELSFMRIRIPLLFLIRIRLGIRNRSKLIKYKFLCGWICIQKNKNLETSPFN